MIKMGMIGIGAKAWQNVLKAPIGSPFSVQANFVMFNSYIQSLTSGTSQVFTIGAHNVATGANANRSPMIFGGKILKIFVVNHEAVGGKVGYLVPMVNGAEQTDMKCDFTSTTEVNEEFTSPDGVEVSFSATDEIGYKLASTSGALDFDDWSIMIVVGFNIGESTA